MNKAVKFTFLTIGIDLFVAFLIALWLLTVPKNPLMDLTDFILDYSFNFVLGVLILFCSGYYVGKKMQNFICTKKRNAGMSGMIWLMLILVFGIFGASTVGFVEEGIMRGNNIYDSIVDYYFKPFFWILLF